MGMLTGKTAVITGAGRGLGKACAEVFAHEGAQVLATDISGAEEQTAADLGNAVVPFHADLRHDDEVKAIIDTAVEHFGRIDVLVNAAATLAGRSDEYLSIEEYEPMTEVNLRALLVLMKFGVEAMLAARRGGSIVNFSTVGSFNVEPWAPVSYITAKAGVNALSKSIAVEYGPHGIRCNVLAPGFSYSDRHTPEDLQAEMAAKAPLGRLSAPREQAQVAAFLASDLASFVTGAIVPVDGGWAARLA